MKNDTFRKLKVIEEGEMIKEKSVEVKEIDKRVRLHGIEMKRLLREQKFNGRFGYAIAHCQVVEQNPLRFFVLHEQFVDIYKIEAQTIYNAKITKRKDKFFAEEMCLSFPNKEKKARIIRYKQVEVEYQVWDDEKGELSKPIKKWWGGILSQVFQHEIQHFEGDNIYEQEKRDKGKKIATKKKTTKKKVKPKVKVVKTKKK